MQSCGRNQGCSDQLLAAQADNRRAVQTSEKAGRKRWAKRRMWPRRESDTGEGNKSTGGGGGEQQGGGAVVGMTS